LTIPGKGVEELLAWLPRRGNASHGGHHSALLRLSDDEQFLERLAPTPEV
tara:strand:+ start:301 stop:450 length:150 start_codon:yes stop_codon:yes gene_type:complete